MSAIDLSLENHYEVIVVGSGHAGIEAALASARMGRKTLCLTLNIDNIGLMPCNPSIGGPAKGQIVGEIDALGGEMGRAADLTAIQTKVLNRSRGPAVQCLRTQNDKREYNHLMKKILCNQAHLEVRQAMIEALLIDDTTTVYGVVTELGKAYLAHSVVLTTGTFLKGKMHIGLNAFSGGRVGEYSAERLSDTLIKHLRLGRLKTGTPPRLDARSIDFAQMTEQPGDPEDLRFSFRTPKSDRYLNQIACHLTHTTPATHEIILSNLSRSPMYQKVIQGVGPRYCPSIEDKVVRFADKDRHQIFIEPEGRDTNDMYAQGLNTSLPEDAQEAFLKTMPGLQNVKILKPGYAVEYDFVYPDQLHPTLETKPIHHLFLAGQINGTSGYEEAAGQGLIAGINAALSSQNQPPFILTREDSYIGTMIDDLITKNIYEPYRMLTSRSEYRLVLRQDNAVFRLSQRAHALGLISDDEWTGIQSEKRHIEGLIVKWKKESTPEAAVSQFNLRQKTLLYEFIKRPEVDLSALMALGCIATEDLDYGQRALVQVKYEGYLLKQEAEIARIRHYDSKALPENLDYAQILGLKKESVEKFTRFSPKTIFEAKRISGINPADLMVLVTYLEKHGRRG